jgi:hypothetical protein
LSPNPGRTASPIWPDLIYDRHNHLTKSLFEVRVSAPGMECLRRVFGHILPVLMLGIATRFGEKFTIDNLKL